MAIELVPDALGNIKGEVRYPPTFDPGLISGGRRWTCRTSLRTTWASARTSSSTCWHAPAWPNAARWTSPRPSGACSSADILATARVGGRLVGISRAITDFSYCTYLADLAVDEAFQRRGIGQELIRRTHEAAGLNTTLILLAAPKARGYYPHIGMSGHDSCWVIPRQAGKTAGRRS